MLRARRKCDGHFYRMILRFFRDQSVTTGHTAMLL
jgi:hypothetical protein